jgi:tetratricopeptide (TPR) repeat protein
MRTNDPSVSQSAPPWLWLAAGVVLAALVTFFFRAKKPDASPPPEAEVERSSARPEPRQLADAVYLRILQDEGARSAEEKLNRAIDGIARARNLTADEVREVLTRFAAGVEANGSRNGYDAAVASAIRGRFEGLPATTASPDPMGGPLRKIDALIAAKDWDAAENAYNELHRRVDRRLDSEGYARVQAAAFLLRYAQDRLDEALTLAREVREIRERVLPPDSPGIARALENVAVCFARTNRDEDAVPLYQRALAIYEKAYGTDDIDVADTLSELASALADTNHIAEAEAAARRAIPIFEKAGEDYALRLALTCDRLGYALLLAKRNVDAEAALRRAVEIYDHRMDARAKDHSDAVHRLGLSIARQDRRREALPYLKRSTEIGAKWFADDDPLFAVLFHNLAVWADGAGDDALTVEGYTRALQILAKNQRRTKQEPEQMRQTKEFYAAYLQRAGVSDAEIQRKVNEAMR